MANLKEKFKNLLLFKEPLENEKFVLEEGVQEREQQGDQGNTKKRSIRKKTYLLNRRHSQEVRQVEQKKHQLNTQELRVSSKLSENLDYIKNIYSVPQNSDVVIREFDVIIQEKAISAFMVFFDGLTDRKVINDNILQPLMLLSALDIKGDEKAVAEYVRSHLIPHGQLKEEEQFSKIVDEVNFGGCAVFIDGISSAFTADVKGFEHRGVERPNTELVIRGPQEGFTELIRVNTALIRKTLKDEDLIVEGIEIGERSKTPCALMYIKDITNESLVNEVRRRMKSIKTDYLHDSGELEQFIEDGTFLPVPQMIATERPDKVARMLSFGKVVVLVNGSPFALVMPTTFHELIHSAEDTYLRFPFANLLRFIRVLGIIAALLLPGLYIAVTNFHQEMIPTSLLLAIEASREKVPFPSVVEILIMELSFELIREAGIRIPGPIGPTLGIIGALILGQAAVAANIVSPILIIIVAVTGIGSFAFPDYSLGFAFRFLRFGYIFLGAMAGFLGITTGLFIQGMWLVNAKSFGVPFFAPFGPKTSEKTGDVLSRSAIWNMEERPDYVNPQDTTRQPEISRGWIKPKNGEGDQDGK